MLTAPPIGLSRKNIFSEIKDHAICCRLEWQAVRHCLELVVLPFSSEQVASKEGEFTPEFSKKQLKGAMLSDERPASHLKQNRLFFSMSTDSVS